MKKKILITSTDVMFWLFLRPHAKHLMNKGYQVTIACTVADSFASQEYLRKIRAELPEACVVQLVGSRNPFAIANFRAISELRRLMSSGSFDVVWCNEPVVGVVTRIAAASLLRSPKVFYFAHGLHFFVGGPLLNWFLLPIEWFLSLVTWRMVLINKTDFKLVQRFFPVRCSYVPGIGLPMENFQLPGVDVNAERKRLGFKEGDFVLLAVGELNKNKNHITILRALNHLCNSSVKLLICGVGSELDYLKEYVVQNKLDAQVSFLGLRSDVHTLMKCVDVFVHPSRREGLGIAPLEAMASGLPVIISGKHGMKDYSVDNTTGYVLQNPSDQLELYRVLKRCMDDRLGLKRMGAENQARVGCYSLDNVKTAIYELFEERK